MYHVAVHPLAQRLLDHIRRQELLHAGERVGVAVSGGIDSVGLLLLLLELRGEIGIVVSVVHFNHKLRGAESDADEQFVAGLARAHGLEVFCDSDDVGQHAADEKISVEAAARELRYGFFGHLIGEGASGAEASISVSAAPPKGVTPEPPVLGATAPHLNKIATGHTLDDQAETVLLRLIRGTGMKGLGGIHPRIAIEDDDGETCGEIVRPLLAARRRDLQQYLKDIGQRWREDSSNADDAFTRNRLRKLVLPVLEKEFNPSVAENLAELSEIARGEDDYWDNEVAGWMGTAVRWSKPAWAEGVSRNSSLVQIAAANAKLIVPDSLDLRPRIIDLQSRIEAALWLVMDASVDRIWFLGEPVAVQRRLVKAIGEEAGIPLESKHVEEILRFVSDPGPSGKTLSLPLGWKIVRETEHLIFLTPDLRKPDLHKAEAPSDYECELQIPGAAVIAQINSTLEARPVPAGTDAGYNPDQLLGADLLKGPFKVRNWRAGDRFRPSHTKSPRKIKELLQELHVPQAERKLWPVVLSGDEIVWVRGFAVGAQFRAKPGRDAIAIIETSAARDAQAM
jgi:tRNA(Ile)-lysidine synthase